MRERALRPGPIVLSFECSAPSDSITCGTPKLLKLAAFLDGVICWEPRSAQPFAIRGVVSRDNRRPAMHPITLALMGILAYRTYQGKGRLAEWIGHRGPNSEPLSGSGGQSAQQITDLLQSLGAAPLVQGLQDLLKDFQQKRFWRNHEVLDRAGHEQAHVIRTAGASSWSTEDRVADEGNRIIQSTAARRFESRVAGNCGPADARRTPADRARR
jgi:hypothetical protein